MGLIKITNLGLFCLLLIFCVGYASADPAVTRYKVELRGQPLTDAKIIGHLNKRRNIDVVQRVGSWLNIKTNDEKSGWLRMHQVLMGDGKRKKSSGFFGLGRLFGSFSGQSSNQGLTAATGVRGLSASNIRQSQADAEAVEYMDDFWATDDDAKNYASKHNLQAQKVPYLRKDRK